MAPQKYCAYCTSKILYLWHLKNIVHIAPQKYCTYGTSKILCILHLKNNLCLWHLKELCAYGTSKTCCLQLCRLLLLLHLQQKIFFLQGHWRRRGRLRWQGRQNSHGARRQCWPRKELGSPSRRQRRQLSSG